jgi:hypothetical protein
MPAQQPALSKGPTKRCVLDPGRCSGGGAWLACLHLGEPSCLWFNRFLDRSELFGQGLVGIRRPLTWMMPSTSAGFSSTPKILAGLRDTSPTSCFRRTHSENQNAYLHVTLNSFVIGRPGSWLSRGVVGAGLHQDWLVPRRSSSTAEAHTINVNVIARTITTVAVRAIDKMVRHRFPSETGTNMFCHAMSSRLDGLNRDLEPQWGCLG